MTAIASEALVAMRLTRDWPRD